MRMQQVGGRWDVRHPFSWYKSQNSGISQRVAVVLSMFIKDLAVLISFVDEEQVLQLLQYLSVLLCCHGSQSNPLLCLS